MPETACPCFFLLQSPRNARTRLRKSLQFPLTGNEFAEYWEELSLDQQPEDRNKKLLCFPYSHFKAHTSKKLPLYHPEWAVFSFPHTDPVKLWKLFFFFQSCTSGSFLEAIVFFFHSEQIFLKLEKINGCVALDYCQKEWHSKVTPARGLSPLNGSKPVALERHITCLSPYLWQSEEEKHICTVRYLFSKKSGAMFWQRWATSLFNSSFHLMLFSSKTLHF